MQERGLTTRKKKKKVNRKEKQEKEAAEGIYNSGTARWTGGSSFSDCLA